MIWFTVIAILIIFVLWKSTVVYGTTKNSWGDWIPDYTKSKSLDFTYLHLIGLLMLLIPYFNILWFIVLLIWYIKRCSPSEEYYTEDMIIWEPKAIITFLIDIYDVLNRKV